MRAHARAVSLLIVLAASTVFTRGARGDDEMSFAQSLLSEKDYFRAITELKRVKFSAVDEALRELCDVKIGEAYLWSNKYDLSISVLGGRLSAGVVDENRVSTMELLLGLDYVGLHAFPIAEGYFNEAMGSGQVFFPLLYLGLIRAENGSWGESEGLFARAAAASASDEQASVAEALREEVRRAPAIGRKSPVLSGLLSAAVPGSGQVYTGHYVDAAQAFLAVGALSLATYGFYRYESQRNDSYILTGIGFVVTAMFHAANVYGAVKTADYYNMKQKEDFLDVMREAAFSIHPDVR
jgi:hypothetical protein